MMKPVSLDEAIELARLQEGGFNTLLAKARSNTPNFIKTNSNHPPTSSNTTSKNLQPNTTFSQLVPKNYHPSLTSPLPNNYKPDNKPFSSPSKPALPVASLPVQKISPAEMQARREKWLCYNCDDKYSFGHRCKKMQFYLISADEEGNESG